MVLSSRTIRLDAGDSEWLLRLMAAGPDMARLLLRLEEDAFADAKPCPFCHGNGEREPVESHLPHAVDCELDRVLFDAGLRMGDTAALLIAGEGEPRDVP